MHVGAKYGDAFSAKEWAKDFTHELDSAWLGGRLAAMAHEKMRVGATVAPWAGVRSFFQGRRMQSLALSVALVHHGRRNEPPEPARDRGRPDACELEHAL